MLRVMDFNTVCRHYFAMGLLSFAGFEFVISFILVGI